LRAGVKEIRQREDSSIIKTCGWRENVEEPVMEGKEEVRQ
jgi:hypothetical protein